MSRIPAPGVPSYFSTLLRGAGGARRVDRGERGVHARRPGPLTDIAAGISMLGLLASSAVQAGDEPATSKLARLQFSGVGWATYRYQLDDQADRDSHGGSRPGTPQYSSKQPLDGKDMNRFDVDRVYLTADYAHDERYAWQTQVEMSNVGGKLDLWMKKAFFRLKSPFGLNKTFVQMGQIAHVFTPVSEKAWGFRSVSRIPIERYLDVSTTWLGLGGGAALGEGLFEGEAAVTNEKGYRSVNESKYKTFMGRVTVAPLAGTEGIAGGMRLVAFAQTNSENSPADFTPSAADNRNVWFDVMPCLVTEKVSAGVEFAQKRDKTPKLEDGETVVEKKVSRYLGGFASAEIIERLRIFGRVDRYDPNTDVDDDGYVNLIAGIAHTHVKGVRGILDLEYTKYEEPEGAEFDPDVTASARIEVTL